MELVSPEECLLPGQTIRLEVEFDKGGELRTAVYPSMVIGLELDVLYVDIPRFQGYDFELPADTPVHVVLTTDESMYAFDTTVTGYERDVPVAMCLAVPDEVMRLQRRNTVRVAADLVLELISHPGLKVELRDISAGGVSFFAPQELLGHLQMRINLGDRWDPDWLGVSAMVRRCTQVQGGYMIASTFDALEPRDEDRVVAYLFKRQRELRQRG